MKLLFDTFDNVINVVFFLARRYNDRFTIQHADSNCYETDHFEKLSANVSMKLTLKRFYFQHIGVQAILLTD